MDIKIRLEGMVKKIPTDPLYRVALLVYYEGQLIETFWLSEDDCAEIFLGGTRTFSIREGA
ncbi:MAG: hypothetical protein DDT19_00073 [Syntrophomonadaceae bacterium]|nr:hypothetical protein [Bacillota bacterium]